MINLILGISIIILSAISCSNPLEIKDDLHDSPLVKVISEVPSYSIDSIKQINLTPLSRRVIMELWRYDSEDSNLSTSFIKREEKIVESNIAESSFEFNLYENGKYRMLFWSDYTDIRNADGSVIDSHYMTEVVSSTGEYLGLKQIEIDTINYCPNSDRRDGFYSSIEFVKTDESLNLGTHTLKRAFGKLVLKEKSEAIYKQSQSLSISYIVPLAFNVERASIVDKRYYQFSAQELPLVGSVQQEDYTLFYDYIFSSIGDEGYTIPNVKLIGKDSRGDIYEKNGLNEIPIRQNVPTNISGTNMLVSPDSNKRNIVASFSDKEVEITNYYAGFNGRSTEGPSWSNTTFLDMIDWMSPTCVRYPGGTQGNSWDWREGTLMGKNPSFKFFIHDIVRGLPDYSKIIYMMNMVQPTPATGYSGDEPIDILKSQEVLQAKISDALDALAEFERLGRLPIAVELGNELYFNNSHAGIYGADPELYMDHALTITKAIKERYPNIYILLCTTKGGTRGRDAWNRAVYSRLSADLHFSSLIRGVVQHHYISENYGSLDPIDTDQAAEDAIKEGFSYIDSIKSDYNNVPDGLKLWITEYGLSKRKDQCGMWVIGMQYLTMSMGWLELGDRIENIQCQHITLSPGLLDREKMKLSSVGIAYGELTRAANGSVIAKRVQFNDVNSGGINSDLYAWSFFKSNGKSVLLLLNTSARPLEGVDLSEVIDRSSVCKQYWCDEPYPNNVVIGEEIKIDRGGDVSSYTLRPFSISVIESN